VLSLTTRLGVTESRDRCDVVNPRSINDSKICWFCLTDSHCILTHPWDKPDIQTYGSIFIQNWKGEDFVHNINTAPACPHRRSDITGRNCGRCSPRDNGRRHFQPKPQMGRLFLGQSCSASSISTVGVMEMFPRWDGRFKHSLCS